MGIYSELDTLVTGPDEGNVTKQTFAVPGCQHGRYNLTVDIPTPGGRMYEGPLRYSLRLHSLKHVCTIQGMKIYCLAEPMYARRKAWKGRDVHLSAWAGEEFEREGQNSVRLAAFCVRREKDSSRRRLSIVGGHLVGEIGSAREG